MFIYVPGSLDRVRLEGDEATAHGGHPLATHCFTSHMMLRIDPGRASQLASTTSFAASSAAPSAGASTSNRLYDIPPVYIRFTGLALLTGRGSPWVAFLPTRPEAAPSPPAHQA